MAQIFQVLLARVGVRVGRRYFALKKTGCLRGFLQGQCRDRAGQGESGSSVVVFSNNQKPSFPSRANLEKQRPTWWQWGSSPFWKQPETDAGTMWEWRPVGAPLKPREINRRNESVRRKWEEEWVCPHCHQSDLWIWTAQVHTHVGGGHVWNTVTWPSRWWERPAGYNDTEDEGNSRGGMTWGRNTRKENGESSLKRNINK